jgi:hypothetical protein
MQRQDTWWQQASSATSSPTKFTTRDGAASSVNRLIAEPSGNMAERRPVGMAEVRLDRHDLSNARHSHDFAAPMRGANGLVEGADSLSGLERTLDHVAERGLDGWDGDGAFGDGRRGARQRRRPQQQPQGLDGHADPARDVPAAFGGSAAAARGGGGGGGAGAGAGGFGGGPAAGGGGDATGGGAGGGGGGGAAQAKLSKQMEEQIKLLKARAIPRRNSSAQFVGSQFFLAQFL